MTVAVAGLWELGWSAPITEADLWRFMLRDFGVDAWYMAPVSGVFGLGVIEYPDMDSILRLAREHSVAVFVDERADMELADFEHPEHATYLFGRANQSPFDTCARHPGDLAVKIATPLGKGMLWPHQAAAIVLYHRRSQWQ